MGSRRDRTFPQCRSKSALGEQPIERKTRRTKKRPEETIASPTLSLDEGGQMINVDDSLCESESRQESLRFESEILEFFKLAERIGRAGHASASSQRRQ